MTLPLTGCNRLVGELLHPHHIRRLPFPLGLGRIG